MKKLLIFIILFSLTKNVYSNSKFIQKNVIAKPIFCLSAVQLYNSAKDFKNSITQKEYKDLYRLRSKNHFCYAITTGILAYLLHKN